jgi:endonuclease/exonuclease/phosphatase family metal-dependent hydrolase
MWYCLAAFGSLFLSAVRPPINGATQMSDKRKTVFVFRGWQLLASRNLRRLAKAAFLILAALGSLSTSRADDGTAIRIVTQNMFQGTEFNAVVQARTRADFFAAVKTAVQNIIASKPAERAAAMAQEIARTHPDLVALQEAAILLTGSALPATTVQMDLLGSLLSELAKLGESYSVVALVPGFDAEATMPGFDAHFKVRDAIIVRTDSAYGEIIFLNKHVQNFRTNLTFLTPIGVVTDLRGWAALDLIIRGRAFRFVTTHLDSDFLPVQVAQAAELIQKAGATTLPLVFAGDFNANASNPTDPTHVIYQLLIKAGFSDAWKQAHPSAPGFTCCQDSDLLNPTSKLSQRIDLVMLRGAISVEEIDLIGDTQTDRTKSGLWPSDHAGLAAALE